MDQLLPGDDESQDWEDLGRLEQQDRVDRLLEAMPAHRRAAFLQFCLEGFDAAEIAMIQDRPEAEVKADIEKAREALKDLLQGRDRRSMSGHQAASPIQTETVRATEALVAES